MILTRMSSAYADLGLFCLHNKKETFPMALIMFLFSIPSKFLCYKLRLYTTFNLCVKVYLFLNCRKKGGFA